MASTGTPRSTVSTSMLPMNTAMVPPPPSSTLPSSPACQYTFSSSVTPGEEELSDLADSLSSLLPQIYQVEEDYSYDRELYLSEENMEHIQAIQDQCSALLIRYTGLTQDDVATLPDLSESRIYQLLEGRMTENL